MSHIGFAQDTTNYNLKANPDVTRYDGATNKHSLYGAGIGDLLSRLYFAVNYPIDSTAWGLEYNQNISKYDKVRNLQGFWNQDSGMVNAGLIYMLNAPPEFSTSTEHNWTGSQIFSRIFIDELVVNKIDSAKSTYWYLPNNTLWGFIDPARDSAYMPKLYIGNLRTRTVLSDSSITTRKIYSDTIIGNSPIFLMADSVIAQNKFYASIIKASQISGNYSSTGALFVNSHLWIYQSLVLGSSFSSGASINTNANYNLILKGTTIPNSDYGYSLGTYNQRWDSLFVKRINVTTVKSEYVYIDYIRSNGNPIYIGQALMNEFDNYYDFGSASRTWKNVYIGTRLYSPTATFSALPVYADNTAALAGGLTAGMLYKTSTGTVMATY